MKFNTWKRKYKPLVQFNTANEAFLRSKNPDYLWSVTKTDKEDIFLIRAGLILESDFGYFITEKPVTPKDKYLKIRFDIWEDEA